MNKTCVPWKKFWKTLALNELNVRCASRWSWTRIPAIVRWFRCYLILGLQNHILANELLKPVACNPNHSSMLWQAILVHPPQWPQWVQRTLESCRWQRRVGLVGCTSRKESCGIPGHIGTFSISSLKSQSMFLAIFEISCINALFAGFLSIVFVVFSLIQFAW